MIQRRKHSLAIDSIFLGSTTKMFVDLENELVLTHSQLLVSLIRKSLLKLLNAMCKKRLQACSPMYESTVYK